MIHIKDPSKLVKRTYSENVIENIDIEYIKHIFKEFSYENCKVLLNGNDLLSKRNNLVKTEPISEMLTEEYFHTKYRRYTKPTNPLNAFEKMEEWGSLVGRMKQPKKN